MMCLVMTKKLFYAPYGLAAQLRGDKENKSLRENRRIKMFAVEGYRVVVCDAFIFHKRLINLFKNINQSG